jgi:hypothetical protein
MILTETVQVRWHNKTKSNYVSITTKESNPKYPFTRFGDRFTVDFADIHSTATMDITLKCDYCGDDHIKKYVNWKTHFDISPVKKDACIKCRGKKTAESNLIVYGTTNVMHIQETKDKIIHTNIEKYGYPSASFTKETQEKIKQTTIKNHGSEYYFQTDEFKGKYIQTMQDKYGVDNAFQAEEIKEKSKVTMLKNHGVEYNMQNPDIRAKAVQSMYERGSTPTSKPQLYLHEIYGGELNYPFQRYNLDIALVDEKIAIEYDGGGHDLKVVLGGISEADFNRRNIIRGTYLKQDGWKLITIKSKKDLLPDETTLMKFIEDSKTVLSTGRSWVTFNIDEETMKYKDYLEAYEMNGITEFRKIRRINNL